jgi:hypothetical protein
MKGLWETARPLQSASLPSWLTPEDIPGYRHIGSFSRAGLSGEEQEVLRDELEQCQAVGLIIDGDPFDPLLQNLYLAAPQREALWSIGIFTGPSPLDLQPVPSVTQPVLTQRDVTDVSAVFLADPFLARDERGWHLFFEVMNWRTCKGEIGCASSTDGLHWTYGRIVLAEAFHLSYPYVFEWEGAWYMVPESYQAGAALLYKATEFPVAWSCVGPLLRGPYLADTSLFRHDGRWWLFTDTSRDFHNDTLRLFHADDLQGPWREHLQSPVVTGNAHIARPGGRVVEVDGRLLRFTQNCMPYYGTDVRAFTIDELTTTTYREREHPGNPILKPAETGWNAGGMHHIDPHRLPDGSWLAAVDGWCWN